MVLPGPATVLPRLVQDLVSDDLLLAVEITLRRAVLGAQFGLAFIVQARFWAWRSSGRGSCGRASRPSSPACPQTMPSIAWFPLAILLFGLTEAAIVFVVVLGAAPSVANGLIHGIDNVPRILRRAGHVLGARGLEDLPGS